MAADIGTQLLLGIVFSAFGMGYVVYGKKQGKLMPLITGIALCAFPYFVSNLYVFLGLGILLVVAPFVWRE